MKIYKFLFPAVFIAVSTAGAGKSWANSDDEYCREFTQTIEVGGKKEEGYGTACQQPDGSWKVVEESGLGSDEGESVYTVENKRIYVEPSTTFIYERDYYRPHYRPYYRPQIGVVYVYPSHRNYNSRHYRSNRHYGHNRHYSHNRSYRDGGHRGGYKGSHRSGRDHGQRHR